MNTELSPTNLGLYFGGATCLEVFPIYFNLYNSLLKLLRFHSKSCVPSALKSINVWLILPNKYFWTFNVVKVGNFGQIDDLSHGGQNYWTLIGWQGIFFLITRALLVIEGMITWCWLAEHACIKLVSRLKRNSETHRFWVWSKHGCFNLTWKTMNM